MGRMTPEEKRRALDLLDEMDRNQLDRVLASVQAFGNWLHNAAYSIYCKVRNALGKFWQSICNLFN